VLEHFEGLGPPVINGHKLLNLQYTDDTLLFLKVDYHMVERVKWALQAFESLSELKINFHTELVALNLDLNVAKNFAIQLNCKLSSLPLKYLDLSLH
jgi:hypothetical protein